MAKDTHIVTVLLENAAYSATRYLAPNLVVRAVRIGGKHKIPRRIYISVKIDRPNYLERRFIKACLKAKEPFPIKKDQLRFPKPAKKAK